MWVIATLFALTAACALCATLAGDERERARKAALLAEARRLGLSALPAAAAADLATSQALGAAARVRLREAVAGMWRGREARAATLYVIRGEAMALPLAFGRGSRRSLVEVALSAPVGPRVAPWEGGAAARYEVADGRLRLCLAAELTAEGLLFALERAAALAAALEREPSAAPTPTYAQGQGAGHGSGESGKRLRKLAKGAVRPPNTGPQPWLR